MRRLVPRSSLLAAACAGAAMVAGAVHGLVGVDADLERSALAAREHRPERVHVTMFVGEPRAADRVPLSVLVRERGRHCRERDPRDPRI